jgi:pyruvate-formate lyase-activating enzyme
MDRKAEAELKQLIKIGVPENMAYLIVSHKYNKKEEVENIIDDIKDEQTEIKNELKNFIELSKNNTFIENENKISNLSLIKENDKN